MWGEKVKKVLSTSNSLLNESFIANAHWLYQLCLTA